MADPLSIASGCAGLLSLTISLVRTTYQYGVAVRSSRKDVAAFTLELTSFRTLLEQVESLSLSGELPASHLQRFESALSSIGPSCSSILQELIEKLERASAEKSRLGAAIQRMAWPLKEEEVVKSTNALGRYRDVLQWAMTADNL